MATVKLSDVRRQQGSADTYYVTWEFTKKQNKNYAKRENFQVVWEYYTGRANTKKAGNQWFIGSDSSTTSFQSTYNPPSNAVYIRVKVKPVAKTYQKKEKNKNNQTVTKTHSYFKGEFCSYKSYLLRDEYIMATPSAPTLSIVKDKNNKDRLYAKCEYKNPVGTAEALKVKKIRFQVIEETSNNVTKFPNQDITLSTVTNSASYTWSSKDLSPGSTYMVRAQAIRDTDEKVVVKSATKKKKAVIKTLAGSESDKNKFSDWSEFSSPVTTRPNAVTGLAVSADTETQVLVSWNSAPGAEKYDIEYTKDDKYFDKSSSEVQTESFDATSKNSRYIGSLDTGIVWYFRIRATNSTGSSAWSAPVNTTIGTKPDPPTTWSYVTSAKIGTTENPQSVKLNWTHNSVDGSEQKAAILEYKVGSDGTAQTRSISDATQSYDFDTAGFSDASVIYWRVKTKGVHADYSEWSTQRQFTLYTPPDVQTGLYSSGKWLWDTFNFETDSIYTAWSDSGELIDILTRFPLLIIAKATPETQHAISAYITISPETGYDTVDETGTGTHVLAGDVIYSQYIDSINDNTINLRLSAGDVNLENNISYTVSVSVAMDSGLDAEGTLSFSVEWEEENYIPDAEITIDNVNLVAYIKPYCADENGYTIERVFLSVFRREYDGSFTEIMSNIDGGMDTTITDPHPSLDYARYRIVATAMDTGGVGYTDIPGVPVEESGIVIQWDEEWRDFNIYTLDDELVDQPYKSSILRLPYNIDISAENKGDVALVEYVGRNNPVSYYGTQRGESGTWSFDIRSSDVETLFALRRLSVYRGDVYVREPSGIGYWAHVQVSYTETHNKPIIPVKLSVTRVEGGT